MISRVTYIVLSLLLIIGAYGSAVAQEADTVSSLPGIEISTSVDKAEIYVGDVIEYIVSITYDTTYQLIPPPLGANLGAFDVKDYQPDIETEIDEGRINSKTIFKLSTFTTGDYTIPPLPVLFMLPDSSVKAMLAEPVPVKVQSLLLNTGDTLDIRPLKDPYEFQRDYTQYYYWGGGGLLALVIALLLWLRFRRRGDDGEPIDDREPWEIAFERLALLSQSGLLTEGEFKKYYIELSEAVREFLGRAYNVDVLEMTTDEFLSRFVDEVLPDGVYDQSRTFLRHADLVKFAKLDPGLERANADFEVIYSIVDKVRADIERQRALEVEKQSQPTAEVTA